MSEEVANPAAEAPVAEASPKVPERYKVPVDGKEIEVGIDDLLSSYSHVKASNDRFEKAAQAKKEAAALRSEAESMKARMKSDPWGVMEELGLDPRTTSEEYLIKKLEFDSLTPEQKRIMELEHKTKTYEEKEAAAKKQEEERAKTEAKEKEDKAIAKRSEELIAEYSKAFITELSASKLPKTNIMVAKVAEKLGIAAQQGWEMSVKQAVKLVEKDLIEYKQAFLRDMDPEALAEFLGEDSLKKIRKRDVEKLKNPPVTQNTSVPREKEDEAPRTPAEWLAAQKKKHGLKN